MSTELTKPLIDSLETPTEKDTIIWDSVTPGFGLRITTHGTKSFFLNYRTAQGRQRRMKLGRYDIVSVDKARKKARKALNKVADDKDPQQERAVTHGQITFKALVEEYIKGRCSDKKSGPEDKRILEKEFVPLWERRLARDVRRHDIMSAAEDIKKRGAPIMANRSLSVLKRLYNFGLDRELIEINPTARVKPVVKEKSRDRVLTAEEIRKFWQALDTLPCEPATRLAMRLILLLGVRPGEAAGLEWSEIEEDENGLSWWTIPKEKSKNGLAHRVPLTAFALELLHSLPHGDEGFVFDSPKIPGRSIGRHAMARTLNRHLEMIGLERFVPHDLRRTCATQLAIMGVSPFTISKILNHVERGVTAIYTRASYDQEKREALEAWAVKLQDILAGRKSKIRRLVR